MNHFLKSKFGLNLNQHLDLSKFLGVFQLSSEAEMIFNMYTFDHYLI